MLGKFHDCHKNCHHRLSDLGEFVRSLDVKALRKCRQYAEERHIDEELRKLLPRDEGKPTEKPAERALRERM